MFDFLSQKFSAIFQKFTGKNGLSEPELARLLDEVREGMLSADVPYAVAEKFIAEVKQDFNAVPAKGRSAQALMKIVHDRIMQFLGGAEAEFSFQLPGVCMIMGLQGSGKTTTLAKLARYVKLQAAKRGKSRRILLASVDFHRPAAIDQLEILAQKAEVSFYRAQAKNPVKAAQEIYAYFQHEGYELLLLDTAGRLHIDDILLQELKSLHVVLHPKYKLLVIDGMTGQESLAVAQSFHACVGISGGIITKMDSATHGGAAFAFRYTLQKPLLFMGTGEGIADFEPFRPDRIAKRLLDLGDVATLQEKMDERVEQSAQKRLYNSFQQGTLTLQDFADQMSMVSQMGNMKNLLRYLPGMGQLKVDQQMIEKGEREMRKFRAIIGSMNQREQRMPKILDDSRKQRIAAGAGVRVSDVNLLLERFEQNQQFVKMFKNMKFFK